jgi:NADH ubiquinone oxidoreductase, 20 Kd subunit
MTVLQEDQTLHILWINAGLSCDGDSVSLTAAMQPSIEDIALGTLPGLPKVAFHWPLIDFESGPDQGADTFIQWFHRADRGEVDPFVLVVEGSIPNEKIKPEGYWAAFGNDPVTNQPITTSEWLDRLAPKALAVIAAGTCATYGGIHAMQGNPTGAMGVPDYLGWDWKSKAGLPIVNVPGCPVQADNMAETLTYLRPRRLLRAGPVRPRVRASQVPGEDRLLGAGREVQRAQARLDERDRRLPQRRRHLHRLHHAGLPGQVHAVHGRAARQPGLDRGQRPVRDRDPRPARDHAGHGRQRAQVAASG